MGFLVSSVVECFNVVFKGLMSVFKDFKLLIALSFKGIDL